MLESPSPPNEQAFKSHPGWRDPRIACPPAPYRRSTFPPTPPPERIPYVYSSLTPPASLRFSHATATPRPNATNNRHDPSESHATPLARYGQLSDGDNRIMRTPFIDQVHANPRSWIIPTEPNRMEMDRVGNDDRYFPPAASMNLPRPSYHQPIPNPFDRQFSLHAEIDHTSSHRDGRPERSGRYARLDGAVDEYPFQPAVQGQFSRSGQVETGFEVAPPAPSPTSSTATAEELDIPTRIGATPFITKLHFALEHPQQFGDVLQWTRSGDSFFVCLSNSRLSVEVLPHLFSHDSLTAFTRQLSIYSFTKLPTSTVLSHLPSLPAQNRKGEWRIYQHPSFQRIDTSNLHLIRPRPSPARKFKQDRAARKARGEGSDEG